MTSIGQALPIFSKVLRHRCPVGTNSRLAEVVNKVPHLNYSHVNRAGPLITLWTPLYLLITQGHTLVVSGLRPDMKLLRDGEHTAIWQ